MKTIALCLAVFCFAEVFSSEVSPLPEFSYQKGNLQEIAKAAREIGAFAIKDLPNAESYFESLEKLKQEAPSCFDKESLDTATVVLNDNVVRTTSAVASNLDSSFHPSCLDVAPIEAAFDAAKAFVNILIQTENEGSIPKFFSGQKEKSLKEAEYLDHIHVYSPAKTENPNFKFTAPFHIDNGLFLLLTPSPENPLIVKDANGRDYSAGNGEVIVVFGRGLNQWLFQERSSKLRNKFRAAPHAVKAVTSERVVMARMIVVDGNAVPKNEKGQVFASPILLIFNFDKLFLQDENVQRNVLQSEGGLCSLQRNR